MLRSLADVLNPIFFYTLLHSNKIIFGAHDTGYLGCAKLSICGSSSIHVARTLLGEYWT